MNKLNWIISKSDKIRCHTDLKSIIEPIWDYVKELNWLITDLDFMSSDTVPISFDHDYFILNPKEFKVLADSETTQIIRGVISGIPAKQTIEIDNSNLPYAEGNELIWMDGHIQYPGALIEIVCYDSSYTIIKFKNEDLSAKFKQHFGEAIELGQASKFKIF